MHEEVGYAAPTRGRKGSRASFDAISQQDADAADMLHLGHHQDVYYHLTNAVAAAKSGMEPRERLESLASCDGAGWDDGYSALVGTPHDARRATVRSSVVTLMNSTMGASMLVLPFGRCRAAVSRCASATVCALLHVSLATRHSPHVGGVVVSVCGEMGIAVFTVLAVVVAYLSNASLKLLTLCVLHSKQSCYQGVGRAAFGWWGATVTSVFIILQVCTCGSVCVCACAGRQPAWVAQRCVAQRLFCITDDGTLSHTV